MIGRVNTGGGGSPNKSTIIVTAPTGSTVTCKMGSTTKTAPEKNGVWTFGGLDLGTWTITSTKGGDSATQDVVITRLTVEYVTIVYRITPEFTYTGDYTIVDDSDNPISDFASWKGNWKIRFLTSGTLTFTNLNGAEGGIDVFLVGGGGGGASPSRAHSGGGGGGYTTTGKNIMVSVGTPYVISIGSGGAIDGDGGNTAAFKLTANGGRHGNSGDGEGGSAAGGDGGSGGGSGSYGAPANGGSNGSDGDAGAGKGGVGQHTTTREFAGTAGKLYAGGGGGGNYFSNGGHDGTGGTGGAGGGGNGSSKSKGLNATAGENNTGGGGGGGSYSMQAAKGGSGIVIIRNKR